MKTKRKVQSKAAKAQVISLAAYRASHRGPTSETAPVRCTEACTSPVDTYCQWLALVGAAWAWWW